MSHDVPGPRPRQVTLAGWVIAVGSAVLVVTVFDTMASLHSIDTRDRLTTAVTTGSLKGLGISVSDALSLIRGALFVAGVAAVVTGILGIFVLQRHTTARIVLTVAAVPVVLTAPFAGGLLSVLIGGATALLWTGEARDWFAGRPSSRPTVEAERAPSSLQPPTPAHRWGQPPLHPPRPPGAAPGPTPSRAGTPEERASWAPPAYAPATGAAAPSRPVPRAVPRELQIACFLTWLFTALTGGAYVVVLLAIAVDRTRVVELVRDHAAVRSASLSDRELVALILGVSAVLVAWCILAAVFAALAWRRVHAGWVLLLTSGVVASFVALVGLPYSVVHLAASAATFVLLLKPSVRIWLRGSGPTAPASGSTDAVWPPPDGQAPPSPDRPQDKPPVW